MTISADQLVPAPAGRGKFLASADQLVPAAAPADRGAQPPFVIPCLVPDFSSQPGSDGSPRCWRWRLVTLAPNGRGPPLRQLIGSEITQFFAAAGSDSRKRPRTTAIGEPSTPDLPECPDSPVSLSDDSGPETEDSEPRKRVRRSEPEPDPKSAAELQLFPINERCTPVPVSLEDDDDDEKKDDKVSTELTLFDKTWCAGRQEPTRYRPAPEKQSEEETRRKLARMRQNDPEDEEEEREKGVGTKLQLYEDPWTIRQKLKPMEVRSGDHGGPMLALLASAGRHVAGLLTKEELEKLVNHRTVAVRLWDADTESPHDLELVRRQVRFGSEMHWVIGFGGNWGPEFVGRRGLKEGDEIGLYWDRRRSRFNFRLIARRVAAGGSGGD